MILATASSMFQSEISRKLASGGPIHSNGLSVTCSNMQLSPIAAMRPIDLLSACGGFGPQAEKTMLARTANANGAIVLQPPLARGCAFERSRLPALSHRG